MSASQGKGVPVAAEKRGGARVGGLRPRPRRAGPGRSSKAERGGGETTAGRLCRAAARLRLLFFLFLFYFPKHFLNRILNTNKFKPQANNTK